MFCNSSGKSEDQMSATNRLLIVDDQQEITRLLETFARTVGYQVLSINDTDQFEKALDKSTSQLSSSTSSCQGATGWNLSPIWSQPITQAKSC